MEDIKKLGIWMCHTSVHLVEFLLKQPEELTVLQHAERHTIESENATFQNEAFHLQTESFKKLGIAIEKYSEVVLFGPVDAKMELMQFLRSDNRFSNIKIDIMQTHFMSEDQQQTYVEKYFST